jgi:TolB-like protein/Tfp pilus assembly protein PilF
MSDKPNKMNSFWQELKRRKVIYVITVYASASFVIIELVNNVLEPLNLPANLSTIMIIALAVGFPIVIVLSWIFDVKPGGVEKTKPADEVTEGKKEVTSNAWRIATYVSVVMIAGLIIFNVFTRLGLTDELTQYGKSIAVLPFINDSQSDEDDMFVNGTMDAIINKLCKIKDLRVMHRESVEPYRDTIVPVAEITEKLGISHVLKGSIRKYGNRVVISVQLIDQNNMMVWSGQYDSDINDFEELFNLESKIAQEVARVIKALITPEEKQRIERVLTTDPMALQLCQEAELDFMEYIQSRQPEYLQRSEKLYREALKRDSTYAEAIAGLGWIYLWEDTSNKSNRDSAKIYADLSLSFDSENSDTYLLLGFYYFFLRDWTAAERNFNKTLEFNPNDPVAYTFLGNIYRDIHGDYLKAIKNYEEAEKRNRGELITGPFYRIFGGSYFKTGFFDLAEEYIQKALIFSNDSALYFAQMGNLEHEKGNFRESTESQIRGYNLTGYIHFVGLWNMIYSEQYEEANRWAKLYEENAPGGQIEMRGYLSLINGEKEKAEQLFNQFMKEFQKGAKLGPGWVANGNGHVDAAMIYAYRGQKDSAYMYLEELVEMKNALPASEIRHLEINSMFDNLREEERFQKILRKMHAEYLAEHERVRLYLKETGRL